MSEPSIDRKILTRFYRDEVKPFRGSILWSMFFMAIAAATTAASAWIIRFLVDDIFIEQNARMLWSVAIGIMLIYFAKGLSTYAFTAILARVSAALSAEMRVKMINTIMRRDTHFFDTHESADLINRISNVTKSAGDLVRVIATAAMRDLLTIIFLIGLMFSLDWKLTLGTFLVAPVGIWGVQQISRRIRSAVSVEFEKTSEFMQILYERLTGIRLVKAYQIEDETVNVLDDTIESLRDRAVRIAKVAAISSPLMETLGGLLIGLMILYAGWAVVNDVSTPGEVFSFIIAFLSAYEPLKRLANLRVDLVKFAIPLKYYYEIIDLKPRQREGGKKLEVKGGEIVFNGLHFAYEEAVPALDGLTFTAPAGKTTALVGRSGSGKSTLFSLLLRYYDPQEGEILIDGQAIEHSQIADVRRALALIPQETTVFTGSIAENIAIGDLKADRKAIISAGHAAYMDEFIENFPQGYDTVLGEGEASLSGGQKQRLSIARAILRDAPILLLDEATSALDSNSEAAVQKAIEEVSQNKTTLVIAHRLSTIRDADKIVVLEKGRVAEEGTHGELMKLDGIYKQLHDLQFSENH